MTDIRERSRFDIGRVIERTFWVMGRNLVLFLPVLLVLTGIPFLGFYYLIYAGSAGLSVDFGASTWIIVSVAGVILGLIGLMAYGAMLRRAISDLSGERASIEDAVQTGIRLFLRILGISVVMGIAIALGYILLIVPGLFLSVLFIVAVPSAVAENTGVFESLGRSAALTEGHRWAVFGLGVIFFVLLMILNMVVGAVGGLTALGIGFNPMLVNIVVTPVVTVIQGMVSLCAAAALYHELRIAKDGMAGQSLGKVFD
jgi:hypothetical protein